MYVPVQEYEHAQTPAISLMVLWNCVQIEMSNAWIERRERAAAANQPTVIPSHWNRIIMEVGPICTTSERGSTILHLYALQNARSNRIPRSAGIISCLI